jgi:beta-barrel assembly-enhancing protease
MRRAELGLIRRGGGGGIRLLIAAVIVAVSFLGYYFNVSENPVTGEKQRIGGLTVEDEIQLGLQARQQMSAQLGGLTRNSRLDEVVDAVGQRLVAETVAAKGKWRYEFHVLADRKMVNAFALPGGQIFITEALLEKMDSEGQLAGVLGHEIGHVIERHGAEHMAKAQLSSGITMAAVVASGDYRTGQMAQVVAGLINMRYGRADELESDRWGVKLMADAGYNPNSMIRVMQILKEAGGGRGQPEFFSTHPDPENRIAKIKGHIKELFPNGVPSHLKP